MQRAVRDAADPAVGKAAPTARPIRSRRRLIGGAVVQAVVLCGVAPSARAAPVDVAVCRIVEDAARRTGLPSAFLTRLVWKESSFRHDVVSSAGAEGIAQFMPGTARERGVADPFDPEEAIPKAAALLAELRQRYGNLGLAAAAYNAGSARVAAWLAGGTLPTETEAYVLDITEQPARSWAEKTTHWEIRDASCADSLADLRRATPARVAASVLLAPWGVQLSGAFSRAAALMAYRRQQTLYAAVLGTLEPMVVGGRKAGRGFRPFFQVRAPAASRAAAAALCGAILRAGGACSVLRS